MSNLARYAREGTVWTEMQLEREIEITYWGHRWRYRWNIPDEVLIDNTTVIQFKTDPDGRRWYSITDKEGAG